MTKCIKKSGGISLKKGQLIRFLCDDVDLNNKIFEVAEDNIFDDELKCWMSVQLVNFYPPIWTHKCPIEILKKTVD